MPPHCFYLDQRLGIKRPRGLPFTLNSAVDNLLKKEFDTHRQNKTHHIIQKQLGADVLPAVDERLDGWRNNFKGVQFHHKPTNFLVFGAIDDLWINSKSEYIVVDYKATAVNEAPKELNKPWHGGYKRQMEVYQWLLRHNGLNMSDTGYFAYCNGRKDKKAFNGKLEFEMNLIPYGGSTGWVEGALKEISECLMLVKPPMKSEECEYCEYRSSGVQT